MGTVLLPKQKKCNKVKQSSFFFTDVNHQVENTTEEVKVNNRNGFVRLILDSVTLYKITKIKTIIQRCPFWIRDTKS